METLQNYIINEVSLATANSAYDKATKDILDITNHLTKKGYNDEALVKKLQRRIRQASTFAGYVDKLNSAMAEACPKEIASLVDKWKARKLKVGKKMIEPIFILSGFEEKEFVSMYDTEWYGTKIDGFGEIMKDADPILPSEIIVIVPETENIAKIGRKNSGVWKAFVDLQAELDELANDFAAALGTYKYQYNFNRSEKRTTKTSKAKEWKTELTSGSTYHYGDLSTSQLAEIENLIDASENLIFMNIAIPDNMRKNFDMNGTVIIGKDEIQAMDKIMNADNTLDVDAMKKKTGGKFVNLDSHRYYSKGDRHGRIL